MAGSRRQAKKARKAEANQAAKTIPAARLAKAKTKTVPDAASTPTDSNAEPFRWSVREADRDVTGDDSCEWSWELPTSETFRLLDFLEEASHRTWGELLGDRTGGRARHKKHHGHSIDSLPRAAVERLRRTGFLDHGEEELFRFRLDGKGRLWGYRSGPLFRVVWWDAEHKVYPTEPK